MKNLSCTIFAALLLSFCTAWADERDTQYLTIFRTIDQADAAAARNDTKSAISGYQKAQTALLAMQKNNPGYNSKAIAFRIEYLSDQIKALTAGTGTAAAESESTPGKAGGGGAVKLVAPGAEPRTALRFHPKTGDKQSVEMIIKMGMGMKIGDAVTPIKLPAMKFEMEMTVTDVSTAGDIKYESVIAEATTVEDADVLPQVAESMKTSLAKIKGLNGTGTISSRGESKGMSMKAPADADAQVRQTIEQLSESFGRISTPLPEEPVGQGAKWEYKFPVKSQGMLINQAVTYELAASEADQLTLKLGITQSAPSQKVQNPALQGMKVDLTKLSGNGTGEMTLDLGKMVPTQATSEIHDEMVMSMNAGGQKQTMNMNLDVNVSISSK